LLFVLPSNALYCCNLQDTLEKQLKDIFPNGKPLWGGRNYCQITHCTDPNQDKATGLKEPPGGLCFSLRCEKGKPGAFEPVETYTCTAPLLLCNGKAQSMCPGAEVYTDQDVDPSLVGKMEGVMGQVIEMLPGEMQDMVAKQAKKLGHVLGNALSYL
jgi:hypothetical protein